MPRCEAIRECCLPAVRATFSPSVSSSIAFSTSMRAMVCKLLASCLCVRCAQGPTGRYLDQKTTWVQVQYTPRLVKEKALLEPRTMGGPAHYLWGREVGFAISHDRRIPWSFRRGSCSPASEAAQSSTEAAPRFSRTPLSNERTRAVNLGTRGAALDCWNYCQHTFIFE